MVRVVLDILTDQTCTIYLTHEKKKKKWIAGIQLSINDNTKALKYKIAKSSKIAKKEANSWN